MNKQTFIIVTNTLLLVLVTVLSLASGKIIPTFLLLFETALEVILCEFLQLHYRGCLDDSNTNSNISILQK